MSATIEVSLDAAWDTRSVSIGVVASDAAWDTSAASEEVALDAASGTSASIEGALDAAAWVTNVASEEADDTKAPASPFGTCFGSSSTSDGAYMMLTTP
jgi:hypothetical protein